MAQQKTIHHLPKYVTISEFARLKGVKRTAVYDRITAEDIIVETVGKEKLRMIDLDKHKDIVFRNYPRTKKA